MRSRLRRWRHGTGRVALALATVIASLLVLWLLSWLAAGTIISVRDLHTFQILALLVAGLGIALPLIRAAREQRKARVHQAWQLLATAAGTSGDMGRVEALEGINKAGGSLAKINLAGEAWLRRVRLPGANLLEAVLQGADMSKADMRDALLVGANLSEVHLPDADLRRAILSSADLKSAHLESANLQGANLWNADLRKAFLQSATLNETDLHQAKLRGAFLDDAVFSNADLREADFRGAIGLTKKQILSAKTWKGALLPQEWSDFPEDKV